MPESQYPADGPSSDRRSSIHSFADLAASGAAIAGRAASGSMPPLAAAPAWGTHAKTDRSVLRRTLHACSIEGIFAELVSACAGGAVLTGWALHLGCSPFVIAVLSATPFVGQLAHLPAAWLVASRSSRKIAIGSVFASRQCYLALALLPLLDLSRAAAQSILVFTALVSGLLAIVGNHAWQVWMADVVPSAIRGRYFGRRLAATTAANATSSIVVGVLMDRAKLAGRAGDLLAVLALFAAAAGAVASVFMARQHEPPPSTHAGREPHFFRRALAPLSNADARAFMAYQAGWNAANGLTAGLFAFYMLQELQTGFVGVALHGLAMGCARMFAAPGWGRLVDRAGARVVLVASTVGVAFLPALWIAASPSFLFPIVLDALIGGVLLGGQSLAGLALPMSLAARRERPFYVAAVSLAGAPCFVVSATAAGALLSVLPSRVVVQQHGVPALHVLFAVACLARVLVVLLSFEVLAPPRGTASALARALGIAGGRGR